MKLIRLAAALAALGLGACGGGGGGSGGGGGNFTLSSQSVTLTAEIGSPSPNAQTVSMHLTDGGTRYVGAGFAQEPPAWIGVDMTGGGADFDVIISASHAGLSHGTYTTVLTVGTADKNGNVLQTKEITVTLVVRKKFDVTGAPHVSQTTYGMPTPPLEYGVQVDANADDTYTASSNAAWVTVPADSFTGPTTIPATIDISDLGIGTHQATITVTKSSAPLRSDTTTVTVTILAPQLSVSKASLLLGGADGLDPTPQSLGFSVNTSTAAHPWTATLQTADGGSWLLADSTSGEVSATAQQLSIDADRLAVPGGTYTGSVKIDVDVRGHALTATIPVTLNKEAERLYVSSDGIAFTQLPSRELLTRDVTVTSTLGRTDVPWTASSDQDWLEVTPSGVTGDTLTLTANPTALAVDAGYVANVTVVSSDPIIENVQVIRVGLWLGSTDPAVLTPGTFVENTMSPVEPLVYAHNGADLISVFNIYTGALVTSFPAGTAAPDSLGISSDGATLFVSEVETGKTYALDAGDGTILDSYLPPDTSLEGNGWIHYARPYALPTLFLGSGRIVDVASGEYLPAAFQSYLTSMAIAPDGRYALLGTGYGGYRLQISRSALSGKSIVLHTHEGFTLDYSTNDLVISPDGTRMLGAAGGSSAFEMLDAGSLEFIQYLYGTVYTNNVEVAWNGAFVGGSQAYYEPVDLRFYDATGGVLGTGRCAGTTYTYLARDSVRISGDGFRVSCVAGDQVFAGNPLYVRDLPTP